MNSSSIITVLLPLPFNNGFSYLADNDLKLEIGDVVQVDFRRKKIYGVVIAIGDDIDFDYKKLKTWDEFIFPLPFSKICYHFGEPISIKKNITDNEIEKLNLLLEEKINYNMEECDKITKS